MSYISLMFRCTKCPSTWGDLIPRSERDPKRTDWPCPSCGEAAGKETLSAPHVMNPNVAKPDGVSRKGWRELSELNRIEDAMVDMRPEEKARAKEEVKKIAEKLPKGEF